MRIGLDISVLNDHQKTGIGVYTYELIDHLLQVNKQDEFVLFGVSSFSTFNYLSNLPFKKNKNVTMRIFRLPARSFRLAFLSWQKLGLPKIEQLIGPVDIFHSFNWYIPPQKRGVTMATVYDLTTILYPQWHLDRTVQLDKTRLNRINNLADKVITISESTKKDFLSLYPGKAVAVIYPGVSEVFIKGRSAAQIQKVLKKYQLRPGYFISLSTIEPRKNLINLVKAYIKGQFPQKLVIVGLSGWKNSELFELIKDNPNILVTGFVPTEDLPSLLNQAVALVYPSFYEGFGIPVLEAMYAQTAVICSQTSSLPEVAGEAALYVNPHKIESLLQAMRKIVSNSSLRVALIKKGQTQAKRFDWLDSAKELNDIYQTYAPN